MTPPSSADQSVSPFNGVEPSRLALLPPELRREIFRLCAWNYLKYGNQTYADWGIRQPNFAFRRRPRAVRLPPLIATCKQFAREAQGIIRENAYVRFVEGNGNRRHEVCLSAGGGNVFRPENIRNIFIEKPHWYRFFDEEFQGIFTDTSEVRLVHLKVTRRVSAASLIFWHGERKMDHDTAVKHRYTPFFSFLNAMPNLKAFEVEGHDCELLLAFARTQLKDEIKVSKST